MNETPADSVKAAKNVKKMYFGQGSVKSLADVLGSRRAIDNVGAVILIDEGFAQESQITDSLEVGSQDQLIFVSVAKEPTTTLIDQLKHEVLSKFDRMPSAVVGIGGGSVLDCAKAVSNLLTNPGQAADYQGWDLVRNEGIYKVGVPTLSGTGAEATRTCVMTNPQSGIKLGMNSDFSVFDEVILDPSLSATVPREQYFYTGMDAYIHCIESLGGNYRHPIGDTHSNSVVQICNEVFSSSEMMSEENRSKLMVASYLGGSAIGMTLVGLVHPFSAGLSVVLGTRHCVSNCIVMQQMEHYYPEAFKDFMNMVEKQEIEIPSGLCAELTDEEFEAIYQATIVHERPLVNALGKNYAEILSKKKVRALFERM